MNPNTKYLVAMFGIFVGGIFTLYLFTALNDVGLLKKKVYCIEAGMSYERSDEVESCEPLTELGA